MPVSRTKLKNGNPKMVSVPKQGASKEIRKNPKEKKRVSFIASWLSVKWGCPSLFVVKLEKKKPITL